MGPEQQPVSQPTEQTPPSQPISPIEPVQTQTSIVPPAPRKTGRIIAIVAGAVGAVLLIVAVLLYFLWWQNPNKMAADAILSVLTSQKGVSKGDVIITGNDVRLAANITGVANGEDTSADVEIKLEVPDVPELTLTVQNVTAKDGAIYLKASGLNDAVDTAVNAIFDASMSNYGITMTETEAQEAKDQMRQQINTSYGPIIDKIENQWLKISADDMTNEESKCIADVASSLRDNKERRAELLRIYQRNNFVVVKNKVESRNGATGFEIDLESDEVKSKIKNFVAEAKETEIVKELEKCGSGTFSDLEDSVSGDSSQASGTLVIWVDNLSHKMTAFKLDIKGGEGNEAVTISTTFDLELGKAANISIPNDARDAKEVISEIEGLFGYSGTSYDESNYDYNLDSYDYESDTYIDSSYSDV